MPESALFAPPVSAKRGGPWKYEPVET